MIFPWFLGSQGKIKLNFMKLDYFTFDKFPSCDRSGDSWQCNCKPTHFCNDLGQYTLFNHSSLILFFLNGHPYNTCAFSQNLVEFPLSAISGLCNAMRCYITLSAISNLIVSDNGYFQCYSTVEFLYLECFGNSWFRWLLPALSIPNCWIFTFPNSSQILHLRALINIFYCDV